MSQLKIQTINKITAIEGGYVNDPDDSGGETNFGITKRTALSYGYQGSMRDMTRSMALRIYEEMYWNELKLSEIEVLSSMIAEELADTSVHAGPGTAGMFLQRSLNLFNNREKIYPDLVIDGVVGNKTLTALRSYLRIRKRDGEIVLYRALNSLQGGHYFDLGERRQKDEKFTFGWFLNRVA